MKNNRSFVIIPAYNEAQTLAEVLQDVSQYFTNIIVVDDGSGDATASIAKSHGVVVASHPINLGQGAALQTGIELSLLRGAENIITFDADGQHNAKDAYDMEQALHQSNADVALGSRFLGGTLNMSKVRKILLKMAIRWTNWSTGQKFTDTHNGLRVFNADVVRQLRITHDGMAHASEILEFICKNNIPFIEFPVTIKYTAYSYSKGQKFTDFINTLFSILFNKLVR